MDPGRRDTFGIDLETNTSFLNAIEHKLITVATRSQRGHLGAQKSFEPH